MSANNNFDEQAYNPSADAAFDGADYQPRGGAEPLLREPDARGGVDASYEDAAAKQSEATGRIDSNEVQGLMDDMRDEERDVGAGTRGVRVDAYAQEREVDEAVDEAIVQDEGQN